MRSPSADRKKFSSVLLGAAFLMATSAIGPGFITQTTVFTEQLLTSFGFVIVCSIVLDIVVQLNIWRIVSVSGLRAQDLANKYFPGTGYVLAFLIILGGLAFNIGNIAGAGLGIRGMTDIEVSSGVVISTVISLVVFWYKDVGQAMDWFTKILGILMIGLTGYIVYQSRPPLLSAIHHSFVPERIDTTAIIILVGGTVGGYISFAGVHRLLDEGISGPENLGVVSRNSVRGIFIVSTMRILLFLAALGIVAGGIALAADNPAASVFEAAAGNFGVRIFGLVLWCASITSVVGSAYTSISFLKTFHRVFEKHQRLLVTGFILVSATIFLLVGRPVKILVIVGALNAFVLPFALALLLIISRKLQLEGIYTQPSWLTLGGWLATIALAVLSIKTMLFDLLNLWH